MEGALAGPAAGPVSHPAPESPALSRIRLRHLNCLVAVARERTLARAAQRLGLSQPAVSKTLSELELLAGRRLVDRGRTGAQLTQAGEQFLRYAVDVTQALQAAAAALQQTGTPPVPAARVGALPTVAAGLLAQAIARLYQSRPHARVEVRTAANPELLGALRSGAVDFAVGRMAEPAAMQGVWFELLYAESLAIVTRPRHPLQARAGRGLSPLALTGYPLVIPGLGTAPRHDAEALFEAHGIGLPQGCTETQSVSAGRALTLLSDAVWITSQHAVQLDVDAGWLCRLDVPAPGLGEPVGLLSRSGADLGELAGRLMDILREMS